MKKLNPVLFALGVIVVGCQANHRQDAQGLKLSPDYTSEKNAFEFYVFGDWGNGDSLQKDLAEMMNKATEVVDPKFIVSAGDNIYPAGVASTDDPLWASYFENVYTGQGLRCPWYIALGNHDYGGNVQAEIDYSKISKRWRMPSRYYTFDETGKDGTTITFVFVDTSPFNDDYYSNKLGPPVSSQDTTRQLNWIDSVLTASKADWKFVVGHHHLYTGGKRTEDTPYVRTHLEKIFIKHRVDAYFCGHEHDLQHIKPDGPTHYFVSGTGSQVRPTGLLPSSLFAASIQGFMTVGVSRGKMKVQVLDYTGNEIYDVEIKK